ncbi:tRNA N6-adenosine threonylcarbamoyltransferase, mitochondrial-like [Babylonia areolata]|uniref:tRNA N6-adenosine threonylcarbamoyltransferase, mitochondrial-like n=1 Tax=Babylonia areolata TaxID=304850 RepID=UPI003FD6AB44
MKQNLNPKEMMRLSSTFGRITYSKYLQIRRKVFETVKVSATICSGGHQLSTSHRRADEKESAERSSQRRLVLGIETSCDDTGAAVVDERGNIVGDALHSQTKTHIELGGIIPPIARDLHKAHIDSVVTQALHTANVSLEDVDAIAVTVKPGLALSLLVGVQHAKMLVQQSGLPLIPIHHMEAHALTARMIHRVDFPFLVLLASGGHCLLAVARDVSDFLLLGTCLDDSPGEAFDKTARQMKLKNLPECSSLSGGAAIELLAKSGNPRAFQFPQVMTKLPDCHFSFAGIKFAAKKLIEAEEKRLNTSASSVVSSAPDICASFQYGVLHHMARRLQRAFLFCDLKHLLPKNRTLVLSGGVASNSYLRSGLQQVCEMNNCQLLCPPPHLCTDNGIMIAWNGMEKLLQGIGKADNPATVDIQPKCPLGKDITQEVIAAAIKLPRLKLK